MIYYKIMTFSIQLQEYTVVPTLRTSDFRFSVFISQTCVVPTLSKQFQVNQKKDKWKIES